MGSANKTGSAARKARIEEMRRAEQVRERRNRFLVIGGSVVAVVALVAGGVFVVKSQSGDDKDTAADGKAASGHFVTGTDGVKTWKGTLGRTHVTKTVKYPTEPPSAGTTTRSG